MAWKSTARSFLTWLFARSTQPLDRLQVIGWWETRRLAWNLIVGALGATGVVIMIVVALSSQRAIGTPIGMPDPPVLVILGAVAFGILANICYTGGWIAELLVRPVLGPERARASGETNFVVGLGFSIILTLVPATLTVLVATIAILKHP
jgi:hypothetical protein